MEPLAAQSPQETQPEVIIVEISHNVTSFLYQIGRADASWPLQLSFLGQQEHGYSLV